MSGIAQRSFSGGELSPSLYARVDQAKYANGLRTCRNFLVMRHGGATNRPGTSFVADVKAPAKTVRLIPFIFNDDQTYVLEFGDLYMRVHRNGAQLCETGKTISGVTKAIPGVVTATSHGFANGDQVVISGVAGMTELNGRAFKVANKTTHTFELQDIFGSNFDTRAFGAYVSGGTAARIYQITTPYAEADLSTLQFTQSADVITIVHPSHAPQELSRHSHTSWSISPMVLGPSSVILYSLTTDKPAGTATYYTATLVMGDTLEESLQCVDVYGNPAQVGTSAVPSSGSPVTVSFSCYPGVGAPIVEVPGSYFNVFKKKNGVWGFIGTVGGNSGGSFVDNGIDPDASDTPPVARGLFAAAGDYPSVVSYFQQRLLLAATNNDPEKVWTSKTGLFKNFSISSPLADDDAVTFSMAGRQVNKVMHLLELAQLVVFTTGGEWTVGGDASGILRPGEVNPKQYAANGAASLRPLVVGGTALYVQARGSIIRDFGFDIQVDGYRGNDLTIFSAHLFDKFTLVDWAYQQVPHSIVWVVRDDGTLLGLTYVREQEMWAWHRHDLAGGIVENVCVVPEGQEDVLYMVVRRTVDGQERRYVERMASRNFADVEDAFFVDSGLAYDGRNTDETHMMSLSGGMTWAHTETLTLTSSKSFFTAADVGNAIHFIDASGESLRFTITGYTSATVVTGKAHKTVPLDLRGTSTALWAKAVDQVGGLWHLEGEDVSIFADGFVVASPNNDSYVKKTVSGGIVSLGKPYAVVVVGLPITADMETLDIDVAQGQSVAVNKKLITSVGVYLEESAGGFVGAKAPEDDDADPLQNLVELKMRDFESYAGPLELRTGVIDQVIPGEWNSNGRVFIRQVDPAPLSVLAVIPSGYVPFRG